MRIYISEKNKLQNQKFLSLDKNFEKEKNPQLIPFVLLLGINEQCIGALLELYSFLMISQNIELKFQICRKRDF